MTPVLIVDDNEDFAFGLGRLLARDGLESRGVASGAAALLAVASASWEVVILDLGLPDLPGLDVLSRILEKDPFCAVVVLTGKDDAATAVRALRLGAVHYLTKPVCRDELVVAIGQAQERFRLRRRIEAVGRDTRGGRRALGASAAFRRAMDALEAAARVPRTSVLITGESGTGKELAASMIHAASDREGGPFVAVNAACFSSTLLENELFGHEAGAFTGAQSPKRGLFELASGGTLFLDEIGELSLELQPKLLRVLEGHAFRRLGGEREIKVDVRFISATNRDLAALVEAGRFRRDLYHRLRVIDVTLPPLRARDGDIELLAIDFVSRLSAELGRPGMTLSPEALVALKRYAWPGNVRELRNVIERGIVLCRTDELGLGDLPPELTAFAGARPCFPVSSAAKAPERVSLSPRSPLLPLEEVIQQHVLLTYEASGENLSRAARSLKISRVALRRRLKQYGVKSVGGDALDPAEALMEEN